MDMQHLVMGVEDYTQQHLPQYLTELTALCAIDSYSYYKPGLDEMAIYLAARMRGLGMDATIVEREHEGNDLLGSLRGDGHGTILLIGHTDTVYPVGIATERPVRHEGNFLLGPGVSDMKGGILLGIYAIEALLAQGYRSFREIRFLCVSDEETNSRHSKDVIEQACQHCDAAFVLEAARANGDIVSARKGSAFYILTAHGRSAHAGVEPEKGLNAIVELAHQVLQFQSLNGWRKGITVNAGTFIGGTAPNVVPDLAQVQFDLRFLRDKDRIATEQRWREMMRQQQVADVELTLTHTSDCKEPMVATPATLQLAERAQEIAQMLGFPLEHTLTGGSSDASYTSGYGIPTLDGLGPIGGHDHSPN